MKTQTLTIDGMSCDHCIMHVKRELSRIAWVKDVQLGKAIVEIDESAVTREDLAKAVDTAGYTLRAVA